VLEVDLFSTCVFQFKIIFLKSLKSSMIHVLDKKYAVSHRNPVV
jgi:hypothetical protein